MEALAWLDARIMESGLISTMGEARHVSWCLRLLIRSWSAECALFVLEICARVLRKGFARVYVVKSILILLLRDREKNDDINS